MEFWEKFKNLKKPKLKTKSNKQNNNQVIKTAKKFTGELTSIVASGLP